MYIQIKPDPIITVTTPKIAPAIAMPFAAFEEEVAPFFEKISRTTELSVASNPRITF